MTKANLIDYIAENFLEPSGEPASKAKLESFKKSDLEAFIKEKGLTKETEKWIDSTN